MKRDGAHEHDVAPDRRAEAAAFVPAEAVDGIAPAVLVVHHLLEQRDKTAARRLYDGVGIADDHGRGRLP